MQITVVSKFVQTAATCELRAPPLSRLPPPSPLVCDSSQLSKLDAQLSFLVRNVINISLGHGLLIVFGRRRSLWPPPCVLCSDLGKTIMYISVAIN